MTSWPSSLPVGGALPAFAPWRASLSLAYARRGDATVPVLRRHHGPLRVQKHFHAEGPAVCQHILVHPPGGIAGGDELAIDIDVQSGAHVLLTSPGAAKWYRADRDARMSLDMRVASGGVLEWLPQETLVFAGARPCIVNRIALEGDARLLFADVTAFGRPGSGERFADDAAGRWQQRGEIRRDSRLMWHEQSVLAAPDRMLYSPAGLQGRSVLATLLWAGAPVPEALHAQCLEVPAPGPRGMSQLPDVWVARCLCDATEAAHAWLRALWALLRPVLLGRSACAPRIWAT